MTWDKLSTTITDKPLVLAGPLLRKVDATSVTVWLALRESATATLSVLDADPADATTPTPLFQGQRASVRVGANLHIVAVTARAGTAPPLAAGKVYFYDLSFATSDAPATAVALSAAVGPAGTAAYAYANTHRPSFALPPEDLEKVRLLLGSCRKPNAEGPDALATLDDLISSTVLDPVGRPHQLIMGGDQIYADEVADLLLLLLTDAAQALLGTVEALPAVDGSAGTSPPPLPTARTDPILKVAKFTTDDTRSHLMTFGEYVAMYLFVWSDTLWPTNLPTIADLKQALASDPERLAKLPKLSPKADDQFKYVATFSQTLAKVRRALANVPVAMILDDHEITDDYNMLREFCDNVYGSPLGMRIVQNGLAAYAFCQHWGNAPDQFEPHAGGSDPAGVQFLHLFDTAADVNAIGDDPTQQATLQAMLGLHAPAQLAARTPYAVFHDQGVRAQMPDGNWIDSQSFLYHYSLEAAAYQVVVTDSRTWRAFPRKGSVTPPDLIAQAQIPVQIGQTPPLNGRQLLVLVTTNMPPGPTIRQATRDLPALSLSYVYEDFYDSWDIQRIDCARMLAQIARKLPADASGVLSGSAVLLTGDVHSSSAQRIAYSATTQPDDPAGAPTKAQVALAQLVGSALHNQSDKTKGQHVQGYAWVPPIKPLRIDISHLLRQPVSQTEGFVGWDATATAANAAVGSFHIQAGAQGIDAPLSFNPDTPTTSLLVQSAPPLWTSQITAVTKSPDYRIRLDYLSAADSSNRFATPPTVIPSADPFRQAADRALAYEAFTSGVRNGSQMVGLNNIGELVFVRGTGTAGSPSLQVRYTVRWVEKDAAQDVRFDVSLDPADPAFPPVAVPA